MKASEVREQGATFELIFHQFLQRTLETELGLQVLQNSLQGSGSQFGKDVQTKWIDDDGVVTTWHFECKSHRTSAVLPMGEIAAKILEINRSSHLIHVWCLALAEVEPSQLIDEHFQWANDETHYPFYLSVLSPQRGFLKDLVACYPDLFARLYPGPPIASPSLEQRETRFRVFKRFLADATRGGREARARRHGRWEQVVAADLQRLPNSAHAAREYLSGRMHSSSWQAVVHGWTVGRSRTEKDLIDRVTGSPPGFSYTCLTGASGEGKSTVLRRVALRISEVGGWRVFFVDSQGDSGCVSVPLEWAEGESSKLLLCVDGCRQLQSASADTEAIRTLSARGSRVFLLLAARGNEWHRSPLRSDLLAHGFRPERNYLTRLTPLGVDEQVALASLLSRYGVVPPADLEKALRRLSAASTEARNEPDKPFLLPTIIQLTDPHDRHFEDILASLLADLGRGEQAAYRLLLATSLAHAAGLGLPNLLAERLLGKPEDLADAYNVVREELHRQSVTEFASLGLGPSSEHLLFTHHRIVAQGLLDVSFDAEDHREVLLALCESIPRLMQPDLDRWRLLPQHLFDILDQTATYLYEDRTMFAAAAKLLRSWAALDPRLFPTMHRLGECYLRWLQAELRGENHDQAFLEALAARARDAYKGSITIAREVLGSDSAPVPLAAYALRATEFRAYHAWSVLEGTVAQRLARPAEQRGLGLRSILLSLLAFEPRNDLQAAKACGTLSLSLMHIGENTLAAQVTSALIELKGAYSVIGYRKKSLASVGHAIPDGGIGLLDSVIQALCEGCLLNEWETVGLVSSRREHVEQLVRALDLAAGWLPSPTLVASARARLAAPAPGTMTCLND